MRELIAQAEALEWAALNHETPRSIWERAQWCRGQAKESAAQSPGLATTGTVNPAATTTDAADPIGYWREDGYGFYESFDFATKFRESFPVYRQPDPRIAEYRELLREAHENLDACTTDEGPSQLELVRARQGLKRIEAALKGQK